jgi:hypothetical protein
MVAHRKIKNIPATGKTLKGPAALNYTTQPFAKREQSFA